jgi:hypothetical protein
MRWFAPLVLACFLVLPSAASGEVQEFLKCKLHEGKTRKDLEVVLNAWRVAANAAGYADLKVKILLPIHAADTRPGVFYWQSVWSDYARMGLGWNWWLESPEASETAAKLNKVFACERDEVTLVIIEK